MRYQLLTLGPACSRYRDDLIHELSDRMIDLGLDLNTFFQCLDIDTVDQLDWDGIPVIVWFGDQQAASPQELEYLDRCLEEGVPIFPVVGSLSTFTQSVPQIIRHLNGSEWQNPPTRLATDILKAYRLTRDQRQAFISYRRSDATGIAIQLFEVFSRCGYRMFLDTASVEAGVDFQEALWCRMADVDLLIFLDTPNVDRSRWVHQELVRAQALGLGVLQLVWPDPHRRTRGTEFCRMVQLQTDHFRGDQGDPQAQLTDAMITQILREAEQHRVRSISSRRLRLIDGVTEKAEEWGLRTEINPLKAITLSRDQTPVVSLLPIVGLPDARVIQQQEQVVQDRALSHAHIVYSGLGLDPDTVHHLNWLNQHRELRTLEVESLGDLIGSL